MRKPWAGRGSEERKRRDKGGRAELRGPRRRTLRTQLAHTLTQGKREKIVRTVEGSTVMDFLVEMKNRNLELLIRDVFDSLDEDDVRRCRMVSRSWRCIVDEEVVSSWDADRTAEWKWTYWEARADAVDYNMRVADVDVDVEAAVFQSVFVSGGWTFVVLTDLAREDDAMMAYDEDNQFRGRVPLPLTPAMVMGRRYSEEDEGQRGSMNSQEVKEWKAFKVRWKYSQVLKSDNSCLVVLGAAHRWDGADWRRRFAAPTEEQHMWIFSTHHQFKLLSRRDVNWDGERLATLLINGGICRMTAKTGYGTVDSVTVEEEVDEGTGELSRRSVPIVGHEVTHASIQLCSAAGRHVVYRQLMRDSLTTQYFALDLKSGRVHWSSEWHLASSQAAAFAGTDVIVCARATNDNSHFVVSFSRISSFSSSSSSSSSSKFRCRRDHWTTLCPIPPGLKSGSHRHFSFRFDTPTSSSSAACFPVLASAHASDGDRDHLRRVVIVADARAESVCAVLHPYGLSHVQLLTPSLVLVVDPGRDRRFQACYAWRVSIRKREADDGGGGGGGKKRELLSQLFSPTGGPRARLEFLAHGLSITSSFFSSSLRSSSPTDKVAPPTLVFRVKDTSTFPEIYKVTFVQEEEESA